MERPVGTVTLVFSDIEGSTRLLAKHAEVYSEIVQRHRAIITEAATRHRGTVVGHEGDSCFLAFGDALAAMSAVVEAQRGLVAEAWPQSAPLRVRMGIHTGDVDVAGNDYYGMAVHVAARVAAAAHGGQIVMTNATYSIGLPEGCETRDLGTHRLRDLTQPVRLHQLVAPGLATEFPPLRALPVAGRLRTPASTFIGREAETKAVTQLLADSRLVTIRGPGGIGKTRFAMHIGNHVGDVLPDGVWFADLTPTEDAESVADVIAEAVGVATRTAGDPLSVVGDLLGHARGLLIIDNFEHVIEAAPVVARLIDTTEDLRILVTSREHLRLRDEAVFELEPLELDTHGSAVQLFLDRAALVREGFEPSRHDIETIAQICRRLDGLPLAIELAAARMRLLQPEEIVQRLTRGAIGLAGGSRDMPSRQQTIRGMIEWSYQLLGPAERATLARLPVFAGPARVDAVDQVIGGAADVSETLAGLVDKSLLQQRVDVMGATRVRMLQLVREFAEELWSEVVPERHDLSARHASYFTDFAQTTGRAMLTNQPDESLRLITADFAEISRAYEWSLDHDPARAVAIYAAMAYYFHTTGSIQTAHRWTKETRSLPADDHVAALRSLAAGYVAFGFRQLSDARNHWQQAIQGVRTAGDPLAEAWATMSLGATFIGDPDGYTEGVELTRSGIALAEEAGSPVLVALGWNILGELSRVYGDDVAADAAYLECSRVARRVGDHYREATVLGNSVYTATHRGDYDLALRHGRAALDIHRRFGHHNQMPWMSIAAAGALCGMGQHENAATLLGAAEAAARRMMLEEMPGDVEENLRIRQQIRQASGDRFEEWYRRGEAMPIEDALRVIDQDAAG